MDNAVAVYNTIDQNNNNKNFWEIALFKPSILSPPSTIEC